MDNLWMQGTSLPYCLPISTRLGPRDKIMFVYSSFWRQTPRSPTPKEHTRKQYCILSILVIRGGMKTLAVRRDFDCCFVGFRVLI